MKKNILISAVIMGLMSAGAASIAKADDTDAAKPVKKKHHGKGKNGCPGKKAKAHSDKDGCKGKDGCSGEKKEGEHKE